MTCYAGFAKDTDVRMSGSSGGLFPVISQRFVQDGGVVYAVVYDDSQKAVFRRIDRLDELADAFSSKYMQAYVGDTFKGVKKDLEAGHRVLFCGTPCQAIGLRRFLTQTKCSTDNLLVIDIICHGVPSEDVFEKYLQRYEDNKCVRLNMRNKENGWIYGRYSWEMRFADGNRTLQRQSDVSYMKCFLSNLSLRPSCYRCKAKGTSGADITLGDFWGIDKVIADIDCKQGVSCIITRNGKGDECIKSLQDGLCLYEVSYNDILVGNPSLENPSRRPFYRKRFFKKYKTADFDTIVNTLGAHSIKNRLINKAYSKLPYIETSAKDLKSSDTRLIFDKKEQCCGCTACVVACPKDAITLKKDSEGFYYPVINTQACINCGLCEKVCGFK